MRLLTFAAGPFILASALAAQGALPPVRHLPAPVSRSADIFRTATVARGLRNGNILVNDGNPSARQVLLLDSALHVVSVTIDSTAGSPNEYGPRTGGLLPWLGDSTLFVEPTTPSMYVIDPAGRVARVAALPIPRAAPSLVQSLLGAWASTDARGRFIYKGNTSAGDRPPPAAGEFRPFAFQDTVPLLRADADTRKVDTLAWYHIRRIAGVETRLPSGTSMSYATADPLPTLDDFAVLSDGTVAILRADMHLDLIGADAVVHPSPRIPFPWERLTDSAKVAVIDSARAAAAARSGNRPAIGATSGSSGGISAGGTTGNQPPPPPPGFDFVAPSKLPDYRPAFSSGAAHADARGNLWIKTTEPTGNASTSIYYVVTRDARVLDRVEIPNDRVLLGFDRDNAVIVMVRGTAPTHLERIRIQ